jgi:uncharacterized protein (TIGR02271 family)
MDPLVTDNERDDVVVPVVSEEVHADAIPVETGSVRVTKHVEGHEEVLEQALRRGRVEIKRVKTDRAVDGPQPVHRSGNTLIVPVVSEVLQVEKRWVVTEEIHITQIDESETVRQTVTVNQESARVERLDAEGNVVSSVSDPSTERKTGLARRGARSGGATRDIRDEARSDTPTRTVLSRNESILKRK